MTVHSSDENQKERSEIGSAEQMLNIRSDVRLSARVRAPVLSIANKLSRLQGTSVANVIVPRHISAAHMDLISATKVARSILRRENPRAKEILIGKLGGSKPLDRPFSNSDARKYDITSLSMVAMAFTGTIQGLPCPDFGTEDIDILRAAFQLDAESGFHDGRLTQKATGFVRERRQVLSEFDDTLSPYGILPRGPHAHEVGVEEIPLGGAPGELVPGRPAGPGGGGRPVPEGGSIAPGKPGTPLFPPGTTLPDPPEPPVQGGDPGICLNLLISVSICSTVLLWPH
jgi:hypothetical protein